MITTSASFDDAIRARHQARAYVMRKPLSEKAMSTHQTLRVEVTDSNQQPRGTLPIRVEFREGKPVRILHDGRDYFFRRNGTHIATGRATAELATVDDARIWATHDAQHIWED